MLSVGAYVGRAGLEIPRSNGSHLVTVGGTMTTAIGTFAGVDGYNFSGDESSMEKISKAGDKGIEFINDSAVAISSADMSTTALRDRTSARSMGDHFRCDKRSMPMIPSVARE